MRNVADFWLWLDDAAQAAAMIGLLPWDFWRMTHAELVERIDAYRDRMVREDERAAWMIHCLLSAWVKKPPSVDRLLGRVTDA